MGIYKHKTNQGFQKGHPDFTKKRREELGLKPPSQKGIKRGEETIRRLRKSHLGKTTSEKHKRIARENWLGNKNPNWNNGSSFEPYTTDWTETLKKSIRQRDKYTCQICGKEPAIVIHHIDYNKQNCNPDNLITLCNSCHTKTNHNRNYWTTYFTKKISKRNVKN